MASKSEDLGFFEDFGCIFETNIAIAVFDQESTSMFSTAFSKYRGVIFLGQVPIFNIEATFLIIRSHFSFDRRWLLL